MSLDVCVCAVLTWVLFIVQHCIHTITSCVCGRVFVFGLLGFHENKMFYGKLYIGTTVTVQTTIVDFLAISKFHAARRMRVMQRCIPVFLSATWIQILKSMKMCVSLRSTATANLPLIWNVFILCSLYIMNEPTLWIGTRWLLIYVRVFTFEFSIDAIKQPASM